MHRTGASRMTDVEHAKATLAYNVEADIRQLVGTLRASWVALAERLYTFATQEMWRDLGHDTLESWLADPELDIGRRNFFYLKGMWHDLVIRAGAKPELLARTESGRWQEVLPAIRRGQVSVESALADCESLSRSDLRERYSAGGSDSRPTANGRVPDLTTHYEAGDERFVICPVCSSRVPEDRLR